MTRCHKMAAEQGHPSGSWSTPPYAGGYRGPAGDWRWRRSADARKAQQLFIDLDIKSSGVVTTSFVRCSRLVISSIPPDMKLVRPIPPPQQLAASLRTAAGRARPRRRSRAAIPGHPFRAGRRRRRVAASRAAARAAAAGGVTRGARGAGLQRIPVRRRGTAGGARGRAGEVRTATGRSRAAGLLRPGVHSGGGLGRNVIEVRG